MTRSRARTLTALFFSLYVLAVIWPGALVANRIRPFVLGLPFSFFWVSLLVVAAAFVLWGLDRVESAHRDGRDARGGRGGRDGAEG